MAPAALLASVPCAVLEHSRPGKMSTAASNGEIVSWVSTSLQTVQNVLIGFAKTARSEGSRGLSTARIAPWEIAVLEASFYEMEHAATVQPGNILQTRTNLTASGGGTANPGHFSLQGTARRPTIVSAPSAQVENLVY